MSSDIYHFIEKEKLQVANDLCKGVINKKNDKKDSVLENNIDDLIGLAETLLLLQVNETIVKSIQKFDVIKNNLKDVSFKYQIEEYMRDFKLIQTTIYNKLTH